MTVLSYRHRTGLIADQEFKVVAMVRTDDSALGHAMAAGPEMVEALAGMIGLVELVIPTLEGSQRIGVEQNHRLEAARAVLARARGEEG